MFPRLFAYFWPVELNAVSGSFHNEHHESNIGLIGRVDASGHKGRGRSGGGQENTRAAGISLTLTGSKLDSFQPQWSISTVGVSPAFLPCVANRQSATAWWRSQAPLVGIAFQSWPPHSMAWHRSTYQDPTSSISRGEPEVLFSVRGVVSISARRQQKRRRETGQRQP
jgi:hypothetical protein